MRQKTQRSGCEWSTEIISIDKNINLIPSPEPYDINRYFRKEWWGSVSQPLFIQEPIQGTPDETRSSLIKIPPVVTWNGKDYPTVRVNRAHTHRNPSPFSINDLCIANTALDEGKTSLMISPTHNYLLIPTEPLPQDETDAIRNREEERVYKEIDQRTEPTLLTKLFRPANKRRLKRYNQELFEYNIAFTKEYKMGLYCGELNNPLIRFA